MQEPHSICLLNDSFPPLIDGVANTVVNYAQELTKLGDQAIVVTPEHPDADDCRFSFPVARYPSVPGSCSGIWRAIPFPRRRCASSRSRR